MRVTVRLLGTDGMWYDGAHRDPGDVFAMSPVHAATYAAVGRVALVGDAAPAADAPLSTADAVAEHRDPPPARRRGRA